MAFGELLGQEGWRLLKWLRDNAAELIELAEHAAPEEWWIE